MTRLFRMALVLAAIAVFFIAVEAHACDCVQFAYEALKRAHVELRTVPAIVGTTGPNSYYRGVVLENNAQAVAARALENPGECLATDP